MYHHSSDSSQFVDIESVFYLAPGEMYWKDLNLVYLGCNRNFLNLTGFKDIKDVVGKTDYDMPWGNSPQLVEKYINDDRYVIETKNKLFTEDQSVITRSGVQVKIFVKTAKAPLFDKDGNVIGVLGLAINITEDKEKEQLEIENQAYMIRAQQDEKFREVIGRAVHDIRAPITSTLAIAKTATELREELRVTLRNAANRINDIANNLLNHYKPDTSDVRIEDKKVPLLLSGAIKEILSEKRAQYHDLALIFEEDVNENSHFAFIEIEIEAFKRTLSNLINNSVDALDKKTGIITVGLKCEANKVKLSIKDNGKGIKTEVLDKIKNNISITDGKKDGHGIG
ncbi:MAG: ATP-binding protein, partial [Neisseriaceae bacterium]